MRKTIPPMSFLKPTQDFIDLRLPLLVGRETNFRFFPEMYVEEVRHELHLRYLVEAEDCDRVVQVEAKIIVPMGIPDGGFADEGDVAEAVAQRLYDIRDTLLEGVANDICEELGIDN